jgi:hypothetical protein
MFFYVQGLPVPNYYSAASYPPFLEPLITMSFIDGFLGVGNGTLGPYGLGKANISAWVCIYEIIFFYVIYLFVN